MDLKGILSVSGHSGLFKHVKQARNALIVESLDTKKRMPVQITAKISALEDIAIFTDGEDIVLKDVFKNIYDKENGGPAINHKASGKELKAYFEEVLPEYDRDRVYVSDIKRIINWYNILQKHEMLTFEEEAAEEETTDENNETDNEAVEKEKEDNQPENTESEK